MPEIQDVVAQWRKNVLFTQENINGAVREVMPAVGRYTRDTIRKRIPPGNTSTSGMSNPFPGYAATGRMRTTIVSGPIIDLGGGKYRIRVGIAANARVLDRIKIFVHEYGMVIRPRRASVLRFQVRGETVFAKKVRIRAKRFMRSGFYEAQINYPRIVEQEMAKRWNKIVNRGNILTYAGRYSF